MADIVEELRAVVTYTIDGNSLRNRAADEIEKLRALLLMAQSHIRYAMANSTVTTSDDPGCFWCDTAGHHAGCSVVALNADIDRAVQP